MGAEGTVHRGPSRHRSVTYSACGAGCGGLTDRLCRMRERKRPRVRAWTWPSAKSTQRVPCLLNERFSQTTGVLAGFWMSAIFVGRVLDMT